MKRASGDVRRYLEFLGSLDLFAGVPAAWLEQILGDLEVVEETAGTRIFEDGEAGDAMYFIAEGSIRLEKKHVHLLSRGRGEYVGEMALIDDEARSAAAVAETDVTLLRWHRRAFLARIGENGSVAFQLCRSLSAKLRQGVEASTKILWDLEHAFEIQSAMLPEPTFDSELLDVSIYCRQADNVGGDYYDYLRLDDSRNGLIIADAQGHGIYAALLVALAKSCFHTQAAIDESPSAVMAAMNRAILLSVKAGRLMSCCYLVIDAGTLSFASGGHPPQYHYRAATGELTELESNGLVLGVAGTGNLAFPTGTRPWQSGDLLVLYTDGVTEAENSDGKELGVARVKEVILDNKEKTPRQIQEAILAALDVHRGAVSFKDDVTLIVARGL